jgi:hypothetical protein
LVLLEMVEDFDMDVSAQGEITSCELDCHITAETHLMKQRQLSMWLDKLFLLEECKLHPRVEQHSFRTEQVIRFLPDNEHVIELCNFKVLRSVMASIVPPIKLDPHFMFEDGFCKFTMRMTVAEGHGENVDVTFPMPESIVAVPKLACSGDAGTAVFGQTTKLCRWQVPRLDKYAELSGAVALHPNAPLPSSGAICKLKFEVVGLNVSGVTVAAVEAASEAQPRLVLRHVVRSVDSTVQSTVRPRPNSPTTPPSLDTAMQTHLKAALSSTDWASKRVSDNPRIKSIVNQSSFPRSGQVSTCEYENWWTMMNVVENCFAHASPFRRVSTWTVGTQTGYQRVL